MKMIRILLPALLIVTLAAAYPGGSESFDIRRASWGMSMNEVKGAEREAGGTLVTEKWNRLAYTIDLAGHPASIVYTFKEGKLMLADVNFLQKHADPAEYISDFENLRAQYDTIMGAPVANEKKWHMETYKEKPDKWGFAVSAGHLEFHSRWRNPRTAVNLVLEGGDMTVTLRVSYGSLLPATAEKKPDEASASEGGK